MCTELQSVHYKRHKAEYNYSVLTNEWRTQELLKHVLFAGETSLTVLTIMVTLEKKYLKV